VLAAVLFLGYGSRTISAPFGESHDGRNARVWSMGSLSLRMNGPVASRLGTRNPVTGVYVNHPPLIYVETAVTEQLGSASNAATRAPAWIGTVVLIFLLYRLLCVCGLRPRAVGMAVLLLVTMPMFLVYGTMLDTPVTSLPFGVGLLVLWERARRGHQVSPLAAAALTAVTVLTGWQAAVLAAVIGTWALFRALAGTGRRDTDLAFATGAVLGFGLLVAWMLWAFGGDLRPIHDQYRARTGQSVQSVGLGALVASQAHYGAALFGAVGLLGVAGLVLACRDPRTRGLAALAIALAVSYTVAFRTGAVNHSYWGYWFLLPLAVGLAAGADRLVGYWRSRGRWEPLLPLTVAVMAVALVVGAWVRVPAAEADKLAGIKVATALEQAGVPAG
jgi:4-amino-4-deoxy-L-arabinose transferase-like glycosyltransferase